MEEKNNSCLRHSLKKENFNNGMKIFEDTLGTISLSSTNVAHGENVFIRSIIMKDNEAKIIEQISKIYNKIDFSEYRPPSIPEYYGFFKKLHENDQIQYNLVFKYFSYSFSNMERIYSFSQIMIFFDKIIQGLAFLQKIGICPRYLEPTSFLFHQIGNSAYINTMNIDFLVLCTSNETKYCKMDSLFGYDYFSPEKLKCLENHDFLNNPYKSETFSLGLIFLELICLKIPERTENNEIWNQNIDEITNPILIEGNAEELKQLKTFFKLLRKCLSLDSKNRPDFIELWEQSEQMLQIK